MNKENELSSRAPIRFGGMFAQPRYDEDQDAGGIAVLTKAVGDLSTKFDTKLDGFVPKSDMQALNKAILDIKGDLATIKTHDNVLDDPLLGLFKSDNDFWMNLLSTNSQAKYGIDRATAQKNIYGDGGYIPRVSQVLLKSTSGFNEAVDSDGAIFLMPQISAKLMQTDPQLAGIEASCFNFPLAGVTYEMNALVDKNHATSVAGGITVSRFGEGVSPNKSKAAFEKVGWKITKQGGYTDITEEALADIPALAAIIPQLFDKAFRFASENDFVYTGSGAAEPLAMLHANNPSLVTVSKESAQAADTIVLANVLKMRARCYNYGEAVWAMTQDAIPQLAVMTLGNIPMFLPSAREDVGDTLLGRPIKYTENASALGDLNDIALICPSQYGIANRLGVQQQSSIHVRFLQGETTLRFIKRNDGQPMWKSPLTPAKGTTKSPFLNLEAR